MPKKTQPAPRCWYQRMWDYYNHAGHRPCGTCAACVEDSRSLERVKQWNRDTAAGAKWNR